MGYRSDVAFTIRGKKELVLPKLVEYRLSGDGAKEALGECRYLEHDGDIVITFRDTDTKWYETYPSVAALTGLFDLFADDEDVDDKFDCAFMRIGEESQDVEESMRGPDPYDLMSMNRSIEMEYEPDDEDTLEKLLCQTTPTPKSPTSSPT